MLWHSLKKGYYSEFVLQLKKYNALNWDFLLNDIFVLQSSMKPEYVYEFTGFKNQYTEELHWQFTKQHRVKCYSKQEFY